jgi:hypothetical protein
MSSLLYLLSCYAALQCAPQAYIHTASTQLCTFAASFAQGVAAGVGLSALAVAKVCCCCCNYLLKPFQLV